MTRFKYEIGVNVTFAGASDINFKRFLSEWIRGLKNKSINKEVINIDGVSIEHIKFIVLIICYLKNKDTVDYKIWTDLECIKIKCMPKRPNNRARRRDDLIWKAVFEEVFDDFLRFFFPNADDLFDMNKKFDYLDKEFDLLLPTGGGGTKGVRYVDKLAKVYLKNGNEKWISIHIEVQNRKTEDDLSSRMLRYWYLVKDKHKVSITALAILTGSSKSFQPKPYVEEYLGTKLTYEFNVYKIIDQDEAELRANPNPFAVVVLVALLAIKCKNADDFTLKEIKKDLIRELIKRKVNNEKRKGIINFIKYYVSFKKSEMMVIFEKESEKLLGRNTTMGTEEYLLQKAKGEGILEGKLEGILEGKLEGKLEEALQIAKEMKVDGINLAQISKYTGITIQKLEKL